jgi:G3E family GTPase
LIVNADEEIFEMNNGCICCTVRGDLIRIIGNLMRQRDRFDHLVIETTGLADPAPVIQTFFMDEDVQAQTRLDAVVTLVDAKHVDQHWDADEVQEQIAFADVILLNKTDLVDGATLDRLEAKIHGMNALAKVYRTQRSELPMEALLGVQAFDLNRALEIEPGFLTEAHDHEHDDGIGSVAIVEPGELDGDKLDQWLSNLLATQGPDIFRMKGILSIVGEDSRFVVQGVHMIFEGQADRPWRADETRGNELVFIGRNLDRQALQAGFRGCLV